MAAPSTPAAFLDTLRRSGQIDEAGLEEYLRHRPAAGSASPRKLAAELVRAGLVTVFQAEQFLLGKHRGFRLGGYRIIDRIGMGGSGLVYLAEHEVIKKRVAIKVLPTACAGDPVVLERFRREARAAALLDHPNVVQVYDFRREGRTHFLVMEYVEGPTLQQLLQRGKRLAVGVACEYARQAAVGLRHAHEAGLVHRDVKPANIIVARNGTVKVLDLGLARLEHDPEGEPLTRKSCGEQVLGTADYLAPEQALSLHDVDARADVYGLGATLFALLTGRPPFHGGTVARKLMMHQTATPAPVHTLRPEVPIELSDLIARMLAKDPADRFAGGQEVAAALERFSTPTHPGLSPSQQTLTDLRLDPLTGGLAGSAHPTLGRAGAADTVMAADQDTLSFERADDGVAGPLSASSANRASRAGGRGALLIGLLGLAVGLAAGAAGLLVAQR